MPYLIIYDEMQEVTDLDKQREIIESVLKKLKESNSKRGITSVTTIIETFGPGPKFFRITREDVK